MKFLIVTASLVTLNAAVAADLPHPPPPAPVVGKTPIGKFPVGKAPIGKYPVGKSPNRLSPKTDAKRLLRPRAGRRLFLCIGVRPAFSRRQCGARAECWASAAYSLVA
jgi:hypothetical protein